MPGTKTVDEYLDKHPEWSEALAKLRSVLTKTELEECVKWGGPCYTLGGKNVVGIGAFKSYCGLWFYQGVFLSDPDGVLVNAQDGKTKALRQWRFEDAKDIKVTKVRAYVKEAIANQLEGKAVAPTRTKTVTVPPELKAALAGDAEAKTAFAALTPGKRKEYAEYVATAKQQKTRESRVEKILPMIRSGVGLNDKYRC